MIGKRASKDLITLITIVLLMIHYNGFRYTVNFFSQLLKLLNSIFTQLNNTSIVTVMFKYCIVFPIVGVILTAIRAPRGKKGHIIGKILYFIIGYFVGLILDYISIIMFS